MLSDDKQSLINGGDLPVPWPAATNPRMSTAIFCEFLASILSTYCIFRNFLGASWPTDMSSQQLETIRGF